MTTKEFEKVRELRVHWASMDDSPYSESWLTPYSLLHFLTGVLTYPLFQILGLSTPLNLILANALHATYEAKDILLSYKIRKFNGRYLNFNSLRNSAGDHVAFTLGQVIAWSLFHKQFSNGIFQLIVVAFTVLRYILYITHSD